MKQSVTSFFESDSKGVALAIITERKTGTDMEKMNGKHYVFQCFIRNKAMLNTCVIYYYVLPYKCRPVFRVSKRGIWRTSEANVGTISKKNF